jgi:hypothetical protein
MPWIFVLTFWYLAGFSTEAISIENGRQEAGGTIRIMSRVGRC